MSSVGSCDGNVDIYHFVPGATGFVFTRRAVFVDGTLGPNVDTDSSVAHLTSDADR